MEDPMESGLQCRWICNRSIGMKSQAHDEEVEEEDGQWLSTLFTVASVYDVIWWSTSSLSVDCPPGYSNARLRISICV